MQRQIQKHMPKQCEIQRSRKPQLGCSMRKFHRCVREKRPTEDELVLIHQQKNKE